MEIKVTVYTVQANDVKKDYPTKAQAEKAAKVLESFNVDFSLEKVVKTATLTK